MKLPIIQRITNRFSARKYFMNSAITRPERHPHLQISWRETAEPRLQRVKWGPSIPRLKNAGGSNVACHPANLAGFRRLMSLREKGSTHGVSPSVSFPCLTRKLSYVTPAVLLIISVFLCPAFSTCGSNRPRILWRLDGRCGRGFPVSTSLVPAQCDPKSDRPCCSDYGYCGNSPSHCICSTCIDFRRIEAKETCFVPHTKVSGYMESPNYPKPYPHGQECCYDVQRPKDDYCGVSLLVEDLDVGRGEEGGYCRQDWLSLPSCVPERGTRICGNQTGQFLQYLFQPGAKSIRFVFHAGSVNLNKRGFKIKYELIKSCPGPYQTQNIPITPIPGTSGAPCYTRITDGKGTINSPFYPDPYPSNLECVYEFARTSYEVCGIRMQSVQFTVEDPIDTPFGGACKDFMHLPSCGFLCGKVNFTWVTHFQPGATSLKFHFHSDENNSTTTPGFLINFEHETDC